ncbi:hypothetical protein LTR60_002019 [Cryomyces antarcticus]|nr:hypothetical protein LTR60_002019 [Cryomyces antarcticus]
MTDNYDSDDAYPQSPGLQPVKFKAKPSPTPPPFLPPQVRATSPEVVSNCSSSRRKRSNRRKTRPSQGDAVLISYLSPNHPDIARKAGEQPLNSAPESEVESEGESDAAMEEGDAERPSTVNLDAVSQAQAAIQMLDARNTKPTTILTTLAEANPPAVSDVPVEANLQERTQSKKQHSADFQKVESNGNPSCHPIPMEIDSSGPDVAADGMLKLEAIPSKGPSTKRNLSEDSISTSPTLRRHTISKADGPPLQSLPAILSNSPSQDGTAGSPQQERSLPSFRTLSELAEVATHANEAHTRAFQHRQSFSSANGRSPVLVNRPYTNGQQCSPSRPSQASPTSTHGDGHDFTSHSPASTTGPGSIQYFYNRRQSQASDNVPSQPPSLTHSQSTGDNHSHPSTDGFSPGTQPTPTDQRTSLDGTPRPTLPLLPGIQPQMPIGGFRCDFAGCTAVPFQTQYLLK